MKPKQLRIITAALLALCLLFSAGCTVKSARVTPTTQSGTTVSDVTTTVSETGTTAADVTSAAPTAAAIRKIRTPQTLPQNFVGDLQALQNALVCFTPGKYTLWYTDEFRVNAYQKEKVSWDDLHLIDSDGVEMPDSILNTVLADFDGDGQNELLVLTLRFDVDVAALGYRSFQEGTGPYSTRDLPQRMNVYGLYLYEAADGGCRLAAKMDPLMIDAELTDYDCSYESGEEVLTPAGTFRMTCPLPVFKENINNDCFFIAQSDGRTLMIAESFLSTTLGDGIEYDCSVLTYRDGRILPLSGAFEIGSAQLGDNARENLSEVIPGYSFHYGDQFSTTCFPAESVRVLFSVKSGDGENAFAVSQVGDEYRISYLLRNQ
ncbi:MAG: hypothetical protein IJK64_06400 [Clostridia bacterium]|nr:hypothetical protein [Clostridia bacterium]